MALFIGKHIVFINMEFMKVLVIENSNFDWRVRSFINYSILLYDYQQFKIKRFFSNDFPSIKCCSILEIVYKYATKK